jgi:D-glycero-alpha-D-manno-heptose-7-phosphate kinase
MRVQAAQFLRHGFSEYHDGSCLIHCGNKKCGASSVAHESGASNMTEWRARAPVRFCDLGGWTDTRIVPRGAVLNFAARMYTYVTLGVKEGAGGIMLESLDTDERCRFQDIRNVEYNGVLDLLKAAVARSGIETHRSGLYSTRREVTVRVRSDAPPASGLGSSAALGVAAIGALSAYQKRNMLPHEVARESQLVEVQDLKLECGVQDQFGAAYGGVSFMEVEYPSARVFSLPLSASTRCELEDRFVLVYTGKSHFSSAMHQKVISEAERHKSEFDQLASAALAGKEALLNGDLDGFAAAMNQNWDAQKKLHPDITTPEIESLHHAAFKAGAAGFKANGAGGGGTVTILVKRNQNTHVHRAAEDLGMQVLPALIDTTGLQVWEVEA